MVFEIFKIPKIVVNDPITTMWSMGHSQQFVVNVPHSNCCEWHIHNNDFLDSHEISGEVIYLTNLHKPLTYNGSDAMSIV